MRITQMMLSRVLGGVERAFLDTVLGLAAQGHQVQAICHAVFPGAKELSDVANVSLEQYDLTGQWDFFVKRKIQKDIQAYQPDVIHSHASKVMRIAGKMSRNLSIPHVGTLHNDYKPKYATRVDQLITITESHRQIMCEQQGVDPAQVSVVPNFTRYPLSLRGNDPFPAKPIIVTLGRLSHEKGFDDLLQAASLLQKEGLDFQLKIGGDGVEKDKLLALSTRLGLESFVEFVGWISDSMSFLQAGDLFINPSSCESFGIVFLEAMAADMPIVATKTRGASEIFTDETAFLSEVKNPQSLADALKEACQNAERRETQKALCQKMFNEKYSVDQVIPQLVAVYQKVI